MLLLLTLVIWNAAQVRAAVSPPATSGDILRFTFYSTPDTVILGESVNFSATLGVTSTTVPVTAGTTVPYTMTWDYNNDGMMEVGPVMGMATVTPSVVGPLPYVYTRTGTFEASATVNGVTTAAIEVEVNGPEVAIGVPAPAPVLGGTSDIPFTINNLTEGVSATGGLELSVVAQAGDTTLFAQAYPSTSFGPIVDNSVTLNVPLIFTRTGDVVVSATLVALPGNPYMVNETVDRTIAVPEATATLSGNGATDGLAVDPGTEVTFQVATEQVDNGAIIGYTFNPGDGSMPIATDGPSASYTYSTAGTFNALVEVNLNPVYGQVLTDDLQVSVMGPSVFTISLASGMETITASATMPGTTPVTATVYDNGTPAPNRPVTVTIGSMLGANFNGNKVVTGTTNMNGEFAAVLSAGALSGTVMLQGMTPSQPMTATAMLNVEAVLEPGKTQTAVMPNSSEQTAELGRTANGSIISAIVPADTFSGTAGVVLIFTEVMTEETSAGIMATQFNVLAYDPDGNLVALTSEQLEALGITVRVTLPASLFGGLALQQMGSGIIPSTLKLYDTTDGTTFNLMSNQSITSSTDPIVVSATLRNFGDHAVIGQSTLDTFLPLILR